MNREKSDDAGRSPSVKEATAGSTATKVLKVVAGALVALIGIVVVAYLALFAWLNVWRVPDALTQKVSAEDVASFVEAKYGGTAVAEAVRYPGIAELAGKPVALRRWNVDISGSDVVPDGAFRAWSTRGDPFHPEEVFGDDAQTDAVEAALAARLPGAAGGVRQRGARRRGG